MTEKDYEDLLEEIADNHIIATNGVKPFNQPNLITINSVNRLNDSVNGTPYSQTAFSSFEVSLPRPALDVKSLQLLSTNIPQCNANIPNTACVFWYYRLSEYLGTKPNINNLYYVRLLPSYYKKESIADPTLYGYNQTFANYLTLSNQLANSCLQDLTYNNFEFIQSNFGSVSTPYYVPFLPNDIDLFYDASINKFKMTGLNTQYAYKIWNETTIYNVGDIVITSGQPYTALIASLNLQPNQTTIDTWTSGNNYMVDNIVSYTTGTTTTTTYIYTCIMDITDSETTPDLDTTHFAVLSTATGVSSFWKPTSQQVVAQWVEPTTYPVGRLVAYNNVLYKCLIENYKQTPDADGSIYWVVFNTTEAYTYLITGYDDPNVKQLQGELFNLQWNPYTLYETNTIIGYNGSYYLSTAQNQNSVPVRIPFGWTNVITYNLGDIVQYNNHNYQSLQDNNFKNQPDISPDFWLDLGVLSWSLITDDSTSLQTGLYGLTKEFDMIEWTGSRLSIQYPYAIAGQPFNPNPKRLLNSILGFTWNGAFNPADVNLGFSTDSEQTLTTLGQVAIYNHLRPIPPYYYNQTITLLGIAEQPTSSTTLTYTADSYANLVYSSIINIYSNLVNASGLDTQKKLGILATTSMNCNNLGVAFWSNYVDNPLIKVNGDIYSITISFEDEFGEPYWLSNNAVATLSFKATY